MPQPPRIPKRTEQAPAEHSAKKPKPEIHFRGLKRTFTILQQEEVDEPMYFVFTAISSLGEHVRITCRVANEHVQHNKSALVAFQRMQDIVARTRLVCGLCAIPEIALDEQPSLPSCEYVTPRFQPFLQTVIGPGLREFVKLPPAHHLHCWVEPYVAGCTLKSKLSKAALAWRIKVRLCPLTH